MEQKSQSGHTLSSGRVNKQLFSIFSSHSSDLNSTHCTSHPQKNQQVSWQRRGLQHVSEATMSGKTFQGLKEQAEGAAKDAANTLGQATQDAVNQITDASQKAFDKASKTAQDGVEKVAGQAAEAMSGFGKKCGFKK
nr:uncharacterized protein LOC100228060 isoform X1 [Taeniopygia guttata]